MWHVAYSVRYSVVPINSSLLTIKLYSSVRTTLVYDTKYSVPFMTLYQSSTLIWYFFFLLRNDHACLELLKIPWIFLLRNSKQPDNDTRILSLTTYSRHRRRCPLCQSDRTNPGALQTFSQTGRAEGEWSFTSPCAKMNNSCSLSSNRP